jgi:sigma-B regulation protein RsbU (phosphoserine phosphatase)
VVEYDQKSRLLIVEDDPHALNFLSTSLSYSGFDLVSVGSAEQAMAWLSSEGPRSLDAVVTDYFLPGQTGLELLDRLQSMDDNLATILITGQGQKSLVQRAMSAGAFDYLEKPVTHQLLREVVARAVARTRQLRRYAEDRRELEGLEELDHSFKVAIPEQQKDRFAIFYRPLHETGGDFFFTIEPSEDRLLILMGDVSGHDIRSGYVSAYFQGMVKGCIESGNAVGETLQLVNQSLRAPTLQGKSKEAGEGVSLSLIALDIRPKEDTIFHWNYGCAPCLLAQPNGFVEACPSGSFPLGWIEQLDTRPHPIPLCHEGALLLYTDGLIETADQLEISPLSLFHRFTRPNSPQVDLPSPPQDDILAIKYLHNLPVNQNLSFEPFLSEHYAGTEVEHIDHLQSVWRRSIHFALNDELGDRLYELLICIREGMLNALVHGCERSPDKFAHLQISHNAAEGLIRVRIDDPGKGHTFNLEQRLEELKEEAGLHLGLGIIHHLSDDLLIDNDGTTLVFDFVIAPEKV